MFSRRQTIRQSAWPCRLIAAVALLSVCASLFPLPLGPTTSAEKDLSEPFPCQNRPCGCRSAEQCWKGCCCFTDEQKVAWAAQNGVKAPDELRERLASTTYTASLALDDTPRKKLSCCERSSGKHCSEQDENKPDSTTPYVIGVLVQQCQGEGPFWNSLPWTIVPAPLEFADGENLVTEAPGFVLHPPPEVCLAPLVPPPRTV